MSKYRIFELAKEFSMTNKEVLEILAKNGNQSAKSHMNSVGDSERDLIKKVFINKQSAMNNAKKPAVKNEAVKSERVNQPVDTLRDVKPPANRPQNVRRDNNGQVGGREKNMSNNQQQHSGVQNRINNAPGGNRQTGGGRTGTGNPVNVRNINNQQGQSGARQYNAQTSAGGNRPAGNNQGDRPNNNRPNTGDNRGVNRNTGGRVNTAGGARPNNNPGTGANRSGNAVNRSNTGGQPNNRGVAGTTPANNRTTTGTAGAAANANRGPTGQTGNRGPNNRFNNRPNNGQFGNRNNAQRNRPGSKNAKRTQGGVKSPKMDIVRPKPKSIKLGESVIVKDLAQKMGYEVSEIIKKLMMLGVMVTINQEIDLDTAMLVAAEFDVTVEELPPELDPTLIPEVVDDPADMIPRPPVVTVMGHVDHGKTSLLDAIRKTQVTAKEAGGITQHIGAYQVMCQGKKIVFLDTPGHEAFTAMRARGAKVTDVAILVVAADDGVMPQTIEAINHAKAAQVPIVVAINKIDRPGANPEHVKQQLTEHGLVSEEWGGDTIMVPVSAKQRQGISDLLEMILLVAEMQELKANPNRAATGIIIEAQLDKGRGPVATVLVQRGTLCVGDGIITGVAHGKVRAMINERGEKVKKAGPSTPVEVLGLTDVPQAGDELAVLDEKQIRTIVEKRIAKKKTDELAQKQKVSLDDLFQQIQDGEIKDLNILIKADVQGSVEALRSSLLALNAKNKEVRVNIIHAAAGAVNESDVMLASAANALIIAFNVRPDANGRRLAEAESIDVRTYQIIYEAINDVEAAMTGMEAPKYEEVVQGRVEIRQVMSFSKALVAGSYVLEGKVTNTSSCRIIRDGNVVHDGKIESLRRFKDDVKEVVAGYECGITIEKFRDIQEGDIIEAYTMEQVKPKNLGQ